MTGSVCMCVNDCCTVFVAIYVLLAYFQNAFNVLLDAFTDQLDLSLIGWVLLLLSRSLDSVRLSNSDDIEHCSSKEREGSEHCFYAWLILLYAIVQSCN